MKHHSYYTYIVCNKYKNVIYVGMTNDLDQRLVEHYLNQGNPKTFAGKFYCHFLVYYERHQYVKNAIEREKEIKGWRRAKKNALIQEFNPEWTFLNAEVMAVWPPEGLSSRGD